jgi:hypothetical protein
MSQMFLLIEQADEKFNFPDSWDGDDIKCFAMRYMINNLEADHFAEEEEVSDEESRR